MAKEHFKFLRDGKVYDLYKLPDGFVFRGDIFLAQHGLKTLPNLPKVTIDGDFACAGLKLTSLEGASLKVNGSFFCNDNQLISLEGAPQIVGKDFICSDNQLTSLAGAPQELGGDFDCRYNQLTSLEGGPQKIGGNFYCEGNKLNSLILLPAMDKDSRIYCDEELGNRYGFYNTGRKRTGICYEDLLQNTLYKTEVAKYNIEAKRQKDRAEGAKKAGLWYENYKNSAHHQDGGRE